MFQLWDHIYKIRDIAVNNIQVESVEVYADEENTFCFENNFARKYSPCVTSAVENKLRYKILFVLYIWYI